MTRLLPRLLQLSALVLVASAVAACGEEGQAEGGDEAVVARVDGHPIRLAELESAYARFASVAGVASADARIAHEVLDGLVLRRLVVQAALDGGIAGTPAYRAEQARLQTRALVGAFSRRVVLDTIRITENDLRRLFVQTQTTYEARHLYARTEQQARALLARLDRGETFEALARETFADPRLAESGGYLGEFAHDEMDPALEAALFDMEPGEVRGPIRTAQGFSVARLESRASSPMLTETAYAERRSKLAQYERRRRETAARYAAAVGILGRSELRYDEAALATLVERWTGRAAPAPLKGERSAGTPVVRFTLDGTPTAWTAADLDALAGQSEPAQLAAVRSASDARHFIEGLVVRESMAAAARRRGYESDAEVERYVSRGLDDWVYETASAEMKADVVPAEADLRARFEAEREGYRHGPRVRVHEVLVETREEADAVLSALRRGADIGDLAAERSIRPGAASVRGALGPVSQDELGRLGGAVFDAAPGALLGPFEVAGRYVVLLRGADVAPTPMTFAEARPQLSETIGRELAQERFSARLDALRDRYSVEINTETVGQARLSAARVPATGGRPAGAPLSL